MSPGKELHVTYFSIELMVKSTCISVKFKYSSQTWNMHFLKPSENFPQLISVQHIFNSKSPSLHHWTWFCYEVGHKFLLLEK